MKAAYSQACEEIVVDLRDPTTGIAFAVAARAYDAGCAVRYVLRQSPGGRV
jgi:alpha-glucosidase